MSFVYLIVLFSLWMYVVGVLFCFLYAYTCVSYNIIIVINNIFLITILYLPIIIDFRYIIVIILFNINNEYN